MAANKQKRSLSSTLSKYIGTPSNKKKVKDFRTGKTTSGQEIVSFQNNGIVVDDIFNISVERIASEISKVTVSHMKKDGTTISGELNDYILKYRPNDTQTMSQFLSYIITQRQLFYNSYIIIKRDEVTRDVKALIPVVNIDKVAIGYNDAKDKFKDIDLYYTNSNIEIPTDDDNLYFFDVGMGNIIVESDENVIHLRRAYGADAYFGGLGALGGNNGDFENALRLIKLKRSVEQGIEKSALSKVNGIIKLNGIQNQEATKEALKDLENILDESSNGFIALDNKVDDVTILSSSGNIIDESLISYIDEKIARISGVPIEILNGSASIEVHNSFFQTTIEPIIEELMESFTAKLLSKNAILDGERIEFSINKLQFMDSKEILEMTRQLGDSGSITENEKRMLVGLPPLPEYDGVTKKNNAWSDISANGLAYDENGKIIK